MSNLTEITGQFKREPQKLAGILFALAIPFTYLSNILFYYLGLCFETNSARSILFILFNIVFALACGFFFLYSLRRKKFGVRQLIPLGLVILFFLGAYLSSYLHFGMTTYWKNYILQFICIAIPALLAGACGGVWQAERKFFPILERISFFLVPASIIYLVGAVFQCNPYNFGANLGIINYMGFAYSLFPFLMALCLRFAAGEEMKAPISGKLYLRPQLVRGMMIALFWLAMMATGCRGPILCVVIFCVLLAGVGLFRAFMRKRTIVLTAVMLGFLLVNLFIISFPGMERLSRMNVFLNGLTTGELSTSSSEELSNEEIDSMVSVQPELTTPPEQSVPSEQPEEDAENKVIINNRGTLFKLAWKEFLKSPITGMGVLGYSVKYGMYSHSALLDLLCETGLLGTIILLGFLCLAVVCILRRSTQSVNMLLFLMPYGVAVNISGYIWISTPLLFALGYGLSLIKAKSIDRRRGA